LPYTLQHLLSYKSLQASQKYVGSTAPTTQAFVQYGVLEKRVVNTILVVLTIGNEHVTPECIQETNCMGAIF
jgi:hypothetical protein